MISLLTDDVNNDLYLDDKGNLALSLTRLQAIKQLVQNKLQTFLGEISINLDEGVDYFGIILPDEIPLESKINELVANILEVPGVLGVSNVDYSIDKYAGQANFDITIQTDAGNINLSDLSLLV